VPRPPRDWDDTPTPTPRPPTAEKPRPRWSTRRGSTSRKSAAALALRMAGSGRPFLKHARAGTDCPCMWRCGLNRVIDLTRPVVMGILNVTPDSFSDGGRYSRHRCRTRARRHGRRGGRISMWAENRPARARTAVENPWNASGWCRSSSALRALWMWLISIDTSKPARDGGGDGGGGVHRQ
jgi:hypothetical protein